LAELKTSGDVGVIEGNEVTEFDVFGIDAAVGEEVDGVFDLLAGFGWNDGGGEVDAIG
jgi:hypothetical protein